LVSAFEMDAVYAPGSSVGDGIGVRVAVDVDVGVIVGVGVLVAVSVGAGVCRRWEITSMYRWQFALV
jgi:hypothetical protein